MHESMKENQKIIIKTEHIYVALTPTLRDPILIEHASSMDGEGGSELEHEVDSGQSPQEHPSEVSAQE